MRKAYLVLYDYGTGGAWAYLRAASAAEIEARYPQLRVYDEPPSFLEPDVLVRLRSELTLEIDDTEHPFLANLPASGGTP